MPYPRVCCGILVRRQLGTGRAVPSMYWEDSIEPSTIHRQNRSPHTNLVLQLAGNFKQPSNAASPPSGSVSCLFYLEVSRAWCASVFLALCWPILDVLCVDEHPLDSGFKGSLTEIEISHRESRPVAADWIHW